MRCCTHLATGGGRLHRAALAPFRALSSVTPGVQLAARRPRTTQLTAQTGAHAGATSGTDQRTSKPVGSAQKCDAGQRQPPRAVQREVGWSQQELDATLSQPGLAEVFAKFADRPPEQQALPQYAYCRAVRAGRPDWYPFELEAAAKEQRQQAAAEAFQRHKAAAAAEARLSGTAPAVRANKVVKKAKAAKPAPASHVGSCCAQESSGSSATGSASSELQQSRELMGLHFASAAVAACADERSRYIFGSPKWQASRQQAREAAVAEALSESVALAACWPAALAAQPATEPAEAACGSDSSSQANSSSDTSQGCEVSFGITCATVPGQRLVLVGSSEQLGGWDLDRAVEMAWTPGHVWVARVVLPKVAAACDFKAVMLEAGQARWTAGANWVLEGCDLSGHSAAVTRSFAH